MGIATANLIAKLEYRGRLIRRFGISDSLRFNPENICMTDRLERSMFYRKQTHFFVHFMCVLTFCVAGFGFSGGASATTVGAAQLVLGLDGGAQQVVNLLIKRLIDVGVGARGAAVAAVVKTDSDKKGANSGFFGDTGLLIASVADADGAAEAKARNKLRGKVNTVATSGKIAAARSVLTWKGRVVWAAPTAALPVLPDVSKVVSAQVNVAYAIEGTDVSVSSPAGLGAGSWDVEHSWNGKTSFLGGVGFDESDPEATFSGDLSALSGMFSSGPGFFSASGLTLADTFGISVDYAEFLSMGEVSAEFAGRMVAEAAIVPVPAALPLLAVGLGFLGIAGWCRKTKIS